MQVWDRIYDELSKIYDSSELNAAILDKIHFKEIRNNDTIILSAPDQLTMGWFKENFLGHASTIAKDMYDKAYRFQVEVDNIKSYQTTERREKAIKKLSPYSLNLNPRYTFEHYVVGPSNDFAHAAAMNVANNPGQTYNPLFIYGNVALGKTHLLQAIAHQILQDRPEAKVLYITSEKFTNDFIEHVIKSREPKQFRKKYRELDVLLIDDIQFFQDKESTVVELFHTFNQLFQGRKQMVFACDRAPKSLSAIEDRLRTRFDSGLTVEIKTPSFETRKAILLDRAERETITIPDNVIDYISKNIDTDVRMLEGSLTKLIAYSNLKKKDISLELAKEILRDKIKIEAPKNITISQIQKVVSKYFGISVNDIKSNKRMESISYPRQIAMYLSKQYTSLSLTEIGHLFGGKAHTTVMRSSSKITKLSQNRKKVKREIDDIIAQFY